MAVPLPILGGAYTDETRPLSSQDTCNYILFPAEKAGTRTEGQLIDAPGLVPFAGVGDGPHRGARDVEGKLFVVSGNKLYQVTPTGVATEIGTIPGTDRVSITHNQIENGNQVLIGTRDNSYVYNTVTGVLAATGVPLFSVDFINQLFVGVDQGRRFWRYSALVDGTDWNSLDNEGAESSPDRIVGLIVSQGEVLVFGERTIEVWANSPNSSTAFQRVQVIERGCASPETICRLDNSVIFLGNDNILYRLEGYSPRPISTHVLTREWGNRDPRKAFAFTYEDKGRVIYYLTHKDGQTFGYDVTTGEFHRLESYGFNRSRLNTLVKWNGEWYGGDFADGTLWRKDWLYMKEGCDEMVRYRRTGVLSDNQRRVTVNSVELLLDMGREPSVEAEAVASVTGNMPDYQIGESVTFQYMFSGSFSGQSAVFSIASGSLPTGLTMDSSGVVTGTVTASGVFSWVVQAVGIGTCSGTGLLADSSEVVAQSWLITYTQPGGDNTSVKISPDGEDWSAAGLLPAGVWNPGNARFARNGANEILITTTTGTPRAVYSSDGGATWVAADGVWSGNATDVVCAGGYWYIGGMRAPVGATPVWSVVPGSAVGGAWGTIGTRIVCSDPGGSTFYQKFWTSDDHVTFTDRGTLGHPDNITVVGMASGDGVLGLVGHLTDSNGDYELVLMSTTTANSGSWQVLTSPFSPNPAGSFGGTCIHYDEVMELWLVSFFDQIAYGPTLDALTLSAHDFPAHIFGIGSDGQKALIVGGDGMVASSTDGATWTPITVGIPVSAIQDVIAL